MARSCEKGSGTGRSPFTVARRREAAEETAVPVGHRCYFLPFFSIALATSPWIEAASLETCSAFAFAPL